MKAKAKPAKKRVPAKRKPKLLGYHFVAETLRDGRPVPADGEWLEHEGRLEMCVSGLHWSKHPAYALEYAPYATRWLCRVECSGATLHDEDKSVSRRRKILARVEAVPLMQAYARWCALSVIHLWDAPAVVREYLETGEEGKRAAARAAAWDTAGAAARAAARAAAWDPSGAAARDAAWAAAEDPSWAAARDAAWAAARDAQRKHFAEMVDAAFGAEQ
jgi:hypothetical protein